MTTLETRIGGPIPARLGWRAFCRNGHRQTKDTVRWRLRDRRDRPDGRGGKGPRWERDCLLCKAASRGRTGSGLRSQSWLPGATS